MRLDFETKMKLAQTTLSRRDSLKIARRFNAGNGLVCASSPAGTAEPARSLGRGSIPKLVGRASSRAVVRQTVLAAREDARPTTSSHCRSVRSSLRDLNHFAAPPGVKTPGYCRSSLRDKTAADLNLGSTRAPRVLADALVRQPGAWRTGPFDSYLRVANVRRGARRTATEGGRGPQT